MTYAQLKAWIETLNAEQLQMDVSIYDRSTFEYHPLKTVGIVEPDSEFVDDVLDIHHPVLTIGEIEV